MGNQTTFNSAAPPAIPRPWLQDLDTLCYLILGSGIGGNAPQSVSDVLKALGLPLASVGIIAKLAAANLNIATDQPIAMPAGKYMLLGVYATNCTGNVTTAAGGIYTAAAKGGNQVIYNGQSYAALTGASNIILPLAFAAGALELSYNNPILYFSLTTPQGAAMTADLYVMGVLLP